MIWSIHEAWGTKETIETRDVLRQVIFLSYAAFPLEFYGNGSCERFALAWDMEWCRERYVNVLCLLMPYIPIPRRMFFSRVSGSMMSSILVRSHNLTSE